MKYTKEECNKIYKKALENFTNEIKELEFSRVSLCGYLSSAIVELNLDYVSEIDFSIDSLPEFKTYQPNGCSQYTFWWDDADTDIRIKVLEACIKQTKE